MVLTASSSCIKYLINIMLTASSQKKIMRSKQSHDLTNAVESRMMHVRSQQNFLERTMIDEVKMEHNFLREMEEAREVINKYQSQLESKSISPVPPADYHQCIMGLYQLERIISLKNEEITQISKDIDKMKRNPDQLLKDSNLKYKTIKNLQFYRLSDEISTQKNQLLELQRKHQRRKRELQQNRKLLKEKIDAHSNLFHNGSRRLMSFSQFVNRKKQKDKQQQPEDTNHKSKRLSRKNLPNHKETAEADEQKKHISAGIKNLTEAENKKKLHETALRVAKKKHQDLINQLNSKLEFLRDQNDLLSEALMKKTVQLKEAELKFSQKQHSSQPKKILKVVRYSEPEL